MPIAIVPKMAVRDVDWAISAAENSTISSAGSARKPTSISRRAPMLPKAVPMSIAAESFGAETTAGELVAATASRYTLRRTDARAGTVHVHFPRVGYVLRKAESQPQ